MQFKAINLNLERNVLEYIGRKYIPVQPMSLN